MKKFSIIIPVYNSEKYLEKCINSALNQGNIEIEIILINDGSTDNSSSICEKYEKEHNNIIYICQENSGPSATRNKGIEIASGEYIVFLDSDDWLTENLLTEIYQKMTINELDMLLFSQRIFNRNGECLEVINPIINIQDLVISGIEFLEKYGKVNPTPVWSYIYRRSFIINNGLFFAEGLYHEDCEFISRAFPSAKRIGFSDLQLYNYLVAEQSIMRSKNIQKCFDLVQISQLVHHNANMLETKSEKAAEEIHKYGAFLSYSAIKSCVIQGFEINKLTSKIEIRKKLLKGLKGNNRYRIISLFLKLRLNVLIKLLILSVDKVRYLAQSGGK